MQPHRADSAPRKRRRVAVVTDSATALPHDLASARGIRIARMEITLGDRTYDDGPQGLGDEQFRLLREGRAVPQTAAPRPAAWLEQIRAAASEAESVLCIALASRLSASFDSARTAAELAAAELPGTEVRVFDSDSAAGSEALVSLAAASLAAAGADLAAVEEQARMVAGRVRLLAYLDTLEYVWRSGRVPRIAVWATNLFDVKPVMEWYRGKVGLVARPRARSRAAARLFAEFARDAAGKRVHVVVMHADAQADAVALRDRIAREFDTAELHLTSFAAFMAAHTGPGLVGVAYWTED